MHFGFLENRASNQVFDTVEPTLNVNHPFLLKLRVLGKDKVSTKIKYEEFIAF
jgi:hypothetical protein